MPLLLLFLFFGCTSGESTLVFECEQQNTGEACNKLGKKKEGAEALRYFQKGCELENTNSCISLAEKTPDRTQALIALKLACDKGNTHACAKYAELLSQKK